MTGMVFFPHTVTSAIWASYGAGIKWTRQKRLWRGRSGVADAVVKSRRRCAKMSAGDRRSRSSLARPMRSVENGKFDARREACEVLLVLEKDITDPNEAN